VSIDRYRRALAMGARFTGHGGLRVNAQLLRIQLEHLERELAGELPVVWSSPLVPAELLAALGIGAVKPESVSAILAAVGDGGRLLERADAEPLSGDCCSFQRAVVAALESGLVPVPQGFVAAVPICDDSQVMGEYLGHKHGKPSFLIDVPATDGPAAEDYVVTQLGELVRVLEGVAGRTLDPGRLAAAVRESNRARAHWREANRLRRDHPPVVHGAASLRLTGGPLLQKLGLPETSAAMSDYAAEIRERIDAGSFLTARRRLLWLHLFPLYDSRFMRFVEEELGLVVAFEESSDVWWDEIDPDAPLPGFARRILGCPFAGLVARRVQTVLRLAREYRVDGVVHFSHRGCKTLTGGFPFVARALRAEGIPVLELSGDCVDNRSPATALWRARLEAFAEMLG
jgi:benzoyl-CoA reductase/2-hydroxyglutaryl-CoA dehydratase subunit BcrC/BadD/HgdB